MELHKQVTEALSTFFDQSDQIDFIDERGDGHHYALNVISDKFSGKTRLERHRLIQSLLSDFIKTDRIHALRMKLKTHDE